MSRNGHKWHANVDEIAAALSLILFTAFEKRGAKESGKTRKTGLQNGAAALGEPCMLYLCPSTPTSQRDMNWWIPGISRDLYYVRQLPKDTEPRPWYTVEKFSIDSSRVIACPGSSNESPQLQSLRNGQSYDAGRSHEEKEDSQRRSTYERILLSDGFIPVNREPFDEDYQNNGQQHANIDRFNSTAGYYIALISHLPLEEIVAQYLFSAFMCAFASCHPLPLGRSRVSMDDPGDDESWKSLKLENSVLSELVQAV